MSVAVADPRFDRDRDEDDGSVLAQRRWGLCFAAVLLLHVAGVWTALHWPASEHTVLPPPPPVAIMIDLAPLPARPAPPVKTPPRPKQEIPRPRPPERVVQQPIVKPAPAAVHVAVPLPPQPRPPERVVPERVVNEDPPKVRPDDPPSASPATAAPAVAEAPPRPAATRAPVAAAPSNAVPTWQGLLLGRLQQFKRYPSIAQQRRQQGVVYARLTMDRRGKVVSATIERSSGFSALDEETLALIRRAEPLPPPPAEVPGDPIEIVVPVQFSLHDR